MNSIQDWVNSTVAMKFLEAKHFQTWLFDIYAFKLFEVDK